MKRLDQLNVRLVGGKETDEEESIEPIPIERPLEEEKKNEIFKFKKPIIKIKK